MTTQITIMLMIWTLLTSQEKRRNLMRHYQCSVRIPRNIFMSPELSRSLQNIRLWCDENSSSTFQAMWTWGRQPSCNPISGYNCCDDQYCLWRTRIVWEPAFCRKLKCTTEMKTRSHIHRTIVLKNSVINSDFRTLDVRVRHDDGDSPCRRWQ